MSCLEQHCLCSDLCEVNGDCILTHELLKGNYFNLVETLWPKSKRKRAKYIISLLESKRKPRVSQQQIDKYFSNRKRTGYDPDRKRVKNNVTVKQTIKFYNDEKQQLTHDR